VAMINQPKMVVRQLIPKSPPLDLEDGYPPAKTSVKRGTSQLCYESWSGRCGVASDVQRLLPLSNFVGVCNVTSRLAQADKPAIRMHGPCT
jgi:hypothetical protein